MRFLALVAAFAVFQLCTGSAALAQANKRVLEAFESGFKTAQDFRTVYEFILPSKDEVAWRKVAWIPSLFEGMQKSKAVDKPMFIWAMNGDPLGCV